MLTLCLALKNSWLHGTDSMSQHVIGIYNNDVESSRKALLRYSRYRCTQQTSSERGERAILSCLNPEKAANILRLLNERNMARCAFLPSEQIAIRMLRYTHSLRPYLFAASGLPNYIKKGRDLQKSNGNEFSRYCLMRILYPNKLIPSFICLDASIHMLPTAEGFSFSRLCLLRYKNLKTNTSKFCIYS